MSEASPNPLARLHALGQSIWVDHIDRQMLEDNTLACLIEQDGVRGVTTNPSIFAEAVDRHREYQQQIQTLAAQGHAPTEIYERITLDDVRAAADVLRPLYDRAQGGDGYVSLEVPPDLARDADATVKTARRLWELIGRPNAMIKVPATLEGLGAIRTLTADGINVNVTLLFSVQRYLEVQQAYINGLSDRLERGFPIGQIASVASFFLSRIDTRVDELLTENDGPATEDLQGHAALACAGLAYRHYEQTFHQGDVWQGLAAHGARPQRLLWASTSTKNPAYSDVKYIEALIGPETVNTVPLDTLAAYRDHGNPQARIHDTMKQAPAVLEALAHHGIDLNPISVELEHQGLDKFEHAYRHLLDTIAAQAGQPKRAAG
ncbi:MAG: transaldolase [Gammaproteobacteria bacterium]